MTRFVPALSLGAVLALMAGCSGPPTTYRAVSTHPTDERQDELASLTKGRAMLAARQYGLAIDAFRAVLRQDSRNADAYNGLAIAYAAIGRADLARQNFELALAHAPSDPKIARNFATFARSQGGGEAPIFNQADRLASVAAEPVADPVLTGQVETLTEAPIVLAKVALPIPRLPKVEAPAAPAAPALAMADTDHPALSADPVAKPVQITAISAEPPRAIALAEPAAPVMTPAPARINVDLAGLSDFRPAVARVTLPAAVAQPAERKNADYVKASEVMPVEVIDTERPAPLLPTTETVLLAKQSSAPSAQAKPAAKTTPRATRPSPQLQRVSLAEVRLVTRPMTPAPADPLNPRGSREIVVVALMPRQQEEVSEARLKAEFWTAVTKAVVRANLKDAALRDHMADPQEAARAIALLQSRGLTPMLAGMAEEYSA